MQAALRTDFRYADWLLAIRASFGMGEDMDGELLADASAFMGRNPARLGRDVTVNGSRGPIF